MPPHAKFTKDEIVDAAFAIFRQQGWEQVSARSIALRLKTSTSPIYSIFSSMEELETEIGHRCVQVLFEYQAKAYTGQRFLDIGVGVIMFAKYEPHLYKDLSRFYDQDAAVLDGKIVEQMKADPELAVIPEARYPAILTKMKIFTFGLAALVQQGAKEVDTEAEIIRYLSEVGTAVMLYEVLSDEDKAKLIEERAGKL